MTVRLTSARLTRRFGSASSTARSPASRFEPPQTVSLPDPIRARFQRGQPTSPCAVGVDTEQKAKVKHLARKLGRVAHEHRLAGVVRDCRPAIRDAPPQDLSWLLVHWQFRQEACVNKKMCIRLKIWQATGQKLPMWLGKPVYQPMPAQAWGPTVGVKGFRTAVGQPPPQGCHISESIDQHFLVVA
jgi:hypothetical protein